jgi:trans-aconitate 2-methyltransferase
MMCWRRMLLGSIFGRRPTHILSAVEDIIEWYKWSGLRPYLEAIDSEAERQRFMSEYLAAIRPLYQPQSDGHVLFPFRRLFMIAYRAVD